MEHAAPASLSFSEYAETASKVMQLLRKLGLDLKLVKEIPAHVASDFLCDVAYDNGVVYAHSGVDAGLVLLHEVAHWLVATKPERGMLNFGVDFQHDYCYSVELQATLIHIGLAILLDLPESVVSGLYDRHGFEGDVSPLLLSRTLLSWRASMHLLSEGVSL